MASRMQNPHLKAPRRLFGITREARQPGVPLKVTRETSIYEIYNHEAEIVDRERIKDWNDSLNTLLIFAALYSAVLTAFIIESMKLLQEDKSETTRDILLIISQQLANGSTPAFQSNRFVVPTWAVRVNFYFFISVSCSLITALAAVLALQWVGSFDRALNQSSPESRAFQRQFRNDGVERWKMDQIIGFLPTVIFFALFIFFIGLADWLWHVHHGVAFIAILGVVIGASFFWVTTLISIIDVGAPFRTTTSRSLPAYLGFLHQKASSTLHLFSLKRILSASRASWKKILKFKAALSKWVHGPHSWPITMSQGKRRTTSTSIWSFLGRWYHPLSKFRGFPVLRYLFKQLVCQDSFDKREDGAISSLETIRRSSLLWLARSISIVPDQYNSFLILVDAFLDLPPGQLIDECVNNAPWKAIFTVLCKDYFDRDSYSEEELKDISFLLHGLAFIGRDLHNDSKLRGLSETFYDGGELFRRMHANIAYWRHSEESNIRNIWVNVSFVYAVEYANRLPLKTIISTLLCIKADIRRHSHTEIDSAVVVSHFSVQLNTLSHTALIPLEVIYIIIDIIAGAYSRKLSPNMDPISAYVAAVRYPARDSDTVLASHEAILQQLCATLRQLKYPETTTSVTQSLISVLLKLSGSPSWQKVASNTRAHLLLAMGYTQAEIWSNAIIDQTTTLLALAMPSRTDDHIANREEWWTHILIGFDEIIQAQEVDSYFIHTALLLNLRRALLYYSPQAARFSKVQIERLQVVQDPYVKLAASKVLQSPELALSMLPLDMDLDNDTVWHDLLQLYCGDIDIIFPEPDIGFLREIMRTGPPEIIESIFTRADFKSPSISLELIRAPVLYKVLQGQEMYAFGLAFAQVHMHPWFMEEFTAANGFHMLSLSCSRYTGNFGYIIDPLFSAFQISSDYEGILLWLICLRDCLAARGLSWQNRKMSFRSFKRVGTHEFVAKLQSLTQKWRYEREGGTPPFKTIGSTADDESFIEADQLDVPIDQCDAKKWTVAEWDALQIMTSEVIPGLRRGYIMPEPSIGRNRDLDGWCAYSRMLK